MTYSIKQLADISGVSTRTLRYYDELGLLKPAYYGDNGYRYYGKDELLMLQQILLYRNVGVKLSNISTIIAADDFDKLEALKSHKQQLLSNMSHLQELIDTVDKTMAHLRGEINMQEIDLFLAFKHPTQLEMADYIESQLGELGQRIVAECKDKVTQLTKEDITHLSEETEWFTQQFRKLINEGIKPESEKTQALMKKYYESRVKPFYEANGYELVELVKIEIENPKWTDKYDQVHPDFKDYFIKSIRIFAEKNL